MTGSRTRGSGPRLSALLLIAVAAVAAVPAKAWAHAMLEGSRPAGGAHLEAAPRSVTVRFNESVEAAFGAIRVYDRHGRRVEAGSTRHAAGRGDELRVKLRRGLGDGGYTVTYRVISGDAHPVSGGFAFSVGAGAPSTHSVDALLGGGDAGPVTSTALGVVRAVQFAAIALALGAVLFLLLAWLPALRETAGSDERWSAASAVFSSRLRGVLLVAAAAGVLGGAAAIALQGAVAGGTSLWAALDAPVIRDVLGTRFGIVWGLGLVAWAWIYAVTGLGPLAPALRPAAVGATGLALPGRTVPPAVAAVLVPLTALALLPALGGHAGVESPQLVLLPADVLHVIAVSAWMGGLATMVLALRAAGIRLAPADRTRLLAASVGRFSMLAGVAITVVVASGVAQSIVYVATPRNLLDTAFGRAVAIKFLLFIALVALGWVNRSRLLPQLRAAAAGGLTPGRAWSLLRRTVRAEVALGVAVLAVTGALAGYAPSTSVSTGPVSREAELGPAHMEATVEPARVGPNDVHLHLSNRHSGAPFKGTRELTVTASLPSEGIAPIKLHARKLGPGRYLARATSLGLTGDWTLAVTSRVSEFDQHMARITVPIK